MDWYKLKKLVLEEWSRMRDIPAEYNELLQVLKTANCWEKVVFPYEWVDTILADDVVIELVSGGKYADYYLKSCPHFKFRLPTSADNIWYNQFYIKLLAIEQSIKSPHRYQPVPPDTSVIDVGASEGIFGFFFCDATNEVHMFDSECWGTCATHNLATRGVTDSNFYAWHITGKSSVGITLNKPLGCIKIDVDGPEIDVLNALEDLINQYHPMLQIAVYHYANEANDVSDWLQQHNYSDIRVSQGWMLYPNDDNQDLPYFRHGLIIAK